MIVYDNCEGTIIHNKLLKICDIVFLTSLCEPDDI